MASLRKKGKVWYVRIRDETGRQIEKKAGPDKSARLADLSQVVDRLPSLWEDSSHTLPTNGVSTGLNGTTPESMKPSPERSGVDPSGHDHLFSPPIR